jgi:hypothetical protein
MQRNFAAVVCALAFLVLLALPGPATAAPPRADGIANPEQVAAFSSRHRRSHRPRYYRSARYGAAPCYYRRSLGIEFPYHYYYRPYLCFGAPFEVPVYAHRYYR